MQNSTTFTIAATGFLTLICNMPSPAYKYRTRYRTTTRGKLKLENLNMIAKIITGDFLKGKKTFLSIGIGLVGFFANKYGVKHEFDGVVELIKLNWDDILVLAGLVGAAWGRIVAKPSGK